MTPPDLAQLEAQALDWAASMLDPRDKAKTTNLDKGIAALCVALLKFTRENGAKP